MGKFRRNLTLIPPQYNLKSDPKLTIILTQNLILTLTLIQLYTISDGPGFNTHIFDKMPTRKSFSNKVDVTT